MLLGSCSTMKTKPLNMRTKQFLTLALCVGVMCSSTRAIAQNKLMGGDLKGVNEKGNPSLVVFDTPQHAVGQQGDVMRTVLGMHEVDNLKSEGTTTDALGFTHEKFQQYYKGVPVEHGVYTAHAKGGMLASLSGEFVRIEGIDVNPTLSEQQALQKALQYVGASVYKWQLAEEEAFLKKETGNLSATFFPQGSLKLVENFNGDKSVRLAYKFDVYAHEPVSRAYIYVDAKNGSILLHNPIIRNCYHTQLHEDGCEVQATNDAVCADADNMSAAYRANTQGSAATRYSGTRTITTDSYNGTYRLRETRGSGLGVQTYNMKKSTSYSAAVDFTDADNSWTEYNNTNKDNAALDAHYGAEKTYDFFLNVLARNSWDGNGGAIKGYVHYSTSYDNAFWDGSRMTYGDGSTFRPLTCVDVAAHEIGHGVCQATAGLVYSYESGAINEALSDIWGACVEYYAEPTKQTWIIGEDIETRTGHVGIRSMSNPNQEAQPDTYQGTSWYAGSADNGGVHTNSGVMNFWFYLLTNGGTGTNDIGSAYNVSGIGITDAAKITFRAEDNYFTSSTNYTSARTYTIQAATDLFGAGSAQVIAVTNAWYAVGVGAAYSGGTTSCGTPTSVTAGSLTTSGATISWAAVSGASSYTLQYKLSTATTWTTISSITTTSRALTGLTSAATYNYQVAAVCGTTTSSYSTAQSFTTTSTTTSCGIPTSVTATAITNTGATISWAAVSGISSYRFQYKLGTSTTWTTISNITSTSYTLTGLTAGTTYNYKVRSVCGSTLSNYSASKSFTTTNATSGCADIYEPNNTSSAAKNAVVNTTMNGLIDTGTDADWFKFTNTSTASRFRVSLTSLPDDFDLLVYNTAGQTVTYSGNAGTTDEVAVYNTTTVGTYYIKIQNYNGNYHATDCYDLKVELSGTNYFNTFLGNSADQSTTDEAVATLSLRPNPAHSKVTVGIPSLREETLQIQLFDQVGRIVMQQPYDATKGENQLDIDLSNLANGLYLVRVQSSLGTHTQRLVVAH
jgi:bacillolysin